MRVKHRPVVEGLPPRRGASAVGARARRVPARSAGYFPCISNVTRRRGLIRGWRFQGCNSAPQSPCKSQGLHFCLLGSLK